MTKIQMRYHFYTAEYYLKHPWIYLREIYDNHRWLMQRALYGYSEIDLVDLDQYFDTILPESLKEYMSIAEKYNDTNSTYWRQMKKIVEDFEFTLAKDNEIVMTDNEAFQDKRANALYNLGLIWRTLWY